MANSAVEAMEKLNLGPESQLKIWTDGAAKVNRGDHHHHG